VSLRLTSIEDGSTIPVIALSAASAIGFLFGADQQYLEESRDAVVAAIRAAETGGTVTDYIPARLLGYFEVFGRSLKEDEAVEFMSGGQPVRFTQETRKRLLAATEDATFTQPVTIVCAIPGADQEKETFQLLLDSDHRIGSSDFATFRDEIMKAFAGYEAGQKVRVRAIGRYDKEGKLQSFDEISSLNLIGPLDVLLRLQELGSLNDGWYEGEGKAPPMKGLTWLSNVFDVVYGDELRPPHLYPTFEGGIRAEWSLGTNDVSCEIDILKRTAEWHELNVENNAEYEKDLNLGTADDWIWMKDRLAKLGGLGSQE
jgi:hypothetical protein